MEEKDCRLDLECICICGFGMHLFGACRMGAVSVPCVWCQSLWSMSDAGCPGISGGVFSEHVSGYSELVSEWHH